MVNAPQWIYPFTTIVAKKNTYLRKILFTLNFIKKELCNCPFTNG